VAVVDTGIDFTQPDLQGQILQGATFTGCAAVAACGIGDFRGPDRVNNGEEHGTHVAGTIAAVRGNGIGVVGVAPGAKLLPVKVLEAGSGSSEDIAAGIRWATDHGADVINMSLGSMPGGQAVSISGLTLR
jgi:subtilisin family serine protease